MENDDMVLLKDICAKYFGLTENVARRHAALGKLPVTAFRLGTRKGPLFVRKSDLEALIEERAKNAETLRNKMATV